MVVITYVRKHKTAIHVCCLTAWPQPNLSLQLDHPDRPEFGYPERPRKQGRPGSCEVMLWRAT